MHLLTLRPALVLLVAALCASTAVHAATQWKWRDKSGHVQYSDLPPPAGTPEADILQRPTSAAAPQRVAPPASAVPASAQLLSPKASDPELEARRKKAEQDEAAKKAAEEKRIAAAKAENCARAQANLKALEDGQRIVRYNAKGEREYLDDSARAAETQRVRGIVASDCK